MTCGKCQRGFVTVWVDINAQCMEPNSLLLKYYTWASLALLVVVAAACLVLKKYTNHSFLLFKTTAAITDFAGHLLFALVLLQVLQATSTI